MSADPSASWRALWSAFGRIGLLSFGGPAAQIALMHQVLVEERRWLDEPRFLNALNFCMLLPGPEAMQLATYCGWMLRGVAGGVLAGLLFVVPGLAVMLALASVAALHGDVPWIEGFLFGLKASVLAVVVFAILRLARKALGTHWQWTLAVLAFLALFVFAVPFPFVIAAAGLVGWWMAGETAPDRSAAPPRDHSHVARTALLWLAVWAAPFALIVATAGVGSLWWDEATFFSLAAIVTFGGAYAVLAYVAQAAVETYGWLAPGEMATGLGLAESTPGPLILVLVFVGFQGAYGMPGGLDPLVAGLLGGALAAWVTFAPCFLWVFLGAPYVERLRGGRFASALTGVSAAIVGVIANLAAWFAIQVLFARTVRIDRGPFDMALPAGEPVWAAIAIAGASILLMARGMSMLLVLALAGVAGSLLAML